jgi:glycerol-1-phosphate dehydrogenase [NAD(P)+]
MTYVAPKILAGSGGLAKVLTECPSPLVCVAPELRSWLQEYGLDGRRVRMATCTDLEAVKTCEASLPPGDVAIGIGGGTAVDNAKYVAWRRKIRLVTMPSAISVDAFLTNMVAVREGNVVKYIGDIWPETVVIDHDLIRAAPRRLNASGAADVLSIHTALFDWAVAVEDCGEPYNEAHAQEAREILARLERGAEEIAALSDRGIDLLVALFSAEVELCARNGNARPEEGSEHLVAYNFERITGKHVIHGELVGTGIALMSRLQDNRPQWAMALMDRLGIRYRPDPADITREELRQTLLTLRSFVESEGCFYSVVNRAVLDANQVDSLLAAGGVG